MPKVVHFEISVDDPERAAEFYKKVFGWKIEKWDGPQEYWLLNTGEEGEPGIGGGMMKRKDGWSGTYNTIQVDSVDNYLTKITAAGGEIAVPKMAIPGVGYMAYFKDTEGIISGVMQMDPETR